MECVRTLVIHLMPRRGSVIMAPSSWWIIRIGRLKLPCWFPQQMQIGLRRDARNDDEHLLHLSSSRLFFPLIFFSSLVTLFLMYVYVFVVISVVKNSKNPIREYCDHYFSRIDRSGGWMWPELNVAIIWESKLWRWGNISLSYGACYWISDDQFSFNYD